MNPNSTALYAGISGVTLEDDQFDFGHGIILSKTFAHLMAPFLMAFAEAEPGQPHPAPWSAVSGGLNYDIHAQLFIPEELDLPNWFDRLNTIWWFLALIRLKGSPLAFTPIISNHPYASIPQLEEQAQFWPIEINTHHFTPVTNPSRILVHNDLDWVKQNWLRGGNLMNSNSEFNSAVQAFDSSIYAAKPSVSLMMLWGAIEHLFSPAKQELRFRLSATLAAFLEAPGHNRLTLHKKIMKLYDARSKVAHGVANEEIEPLVETYALLKRAIVKIIEDGHIPTRVELEALMFGS